MTYASLRDGLTILDITRNSVMRGWHVAALISDPPCQSPGKISTVADELTIIGLGFLAVGSNLTPGSRFMWTIYIVPTF